MESEKRQSEVLDTIILSAQKRNCSGRQSAAAWVSAERQLRLKLTEQDRKIKSRKQLHERGRTACIEGKCEDLFLEFSQKFFR